MERQAGHPPADVEEALRQLAPHIRRQAQKHSWKSSRHGSYDADDLFQEGMIAAHKAYERYDPAVSTSFEAYAVMSAKGAMLRFVRDKGASVRIPRPVYELASKLLKVVDIRDPAAAYARFDEFLLIYGVKPPLLKESLEHIYLKMAVFSLDQKIDEEENGATDLYNMLVEEAYDIEMADRLRVVRERLMEFKPRDASIYLAAVAGLTQVEIAKQHGVSQMHVSRLIRKVGAALKETNDQYDRDGELTGIPQTSRSDANRRHT